MRKFRKLASLFRRGKPSTRVQTRRVEPLSPSAAVTRDIAQGPSEPHPDAISPVTSPPLENKSPIQEPQVPAQPLATPHVPERPLTPEPVPAETIASPQPEDKAPILEPNPAQSIASPQARGQAPVFESVLTKPIVSPQLEDIVPVSEPAPVKPTTPPPPEIIPPTPERALAVAKIICENQYANHGYPGSDVMKLMTSPPHPQDNAAASTQSPAQSFNFTERQLLGRALRIAAVSAFTKPACIAKFLLDAGADVHGVSNAGGWSPLRIAAREGREDLIEMLLDAGAYAVGKNDYGENAYDIAKRKGHTRVYEMLVEKAGPAPVLPKLVLPKPHPVALNYGGALGPSSYVGWGVHHYGDDYNDYSSNDHYASGIETEREERDSKALLRWD